MYLMDQIVETAKLAEFIPKSQRTVSNILQIFPQVAQKLKGTPRFLFDDASIGTAVELTLGRPKILWDVLQNLTIPYPTMWIEWSESGREKLRETLLTAQGVDMRECHITSSRPLPKKVGFLLETTTPARRQGSAVWFWAGGGNLQSALGLKKEIVPNIAPIAPYFDLDAQNQLKRHPVTIENLWHQHPIQVEALNKIWATSAHLPYGKWGMDYVNLYLQNSKDLEMAMADVYGEYIMIWTTLILLTSSRKIVNQAPVSMDKLNKARLRRHEVPRLDYTEVTMYVDPSSFITPGLQTAPGVVGGPARGPLQRPRKPPRIHIVSSYLARRGNKHWIVQPYFRGKGEVISRYTHVTTPTFKQQTKRKRKRRQ